MIENFDYLFHYLEKENITYDKSEFLFQVRSHPDYPSLLSVSDTLRFLGIKNFAIKVEFSQIDLLPDNFITLLREKDNKPQLYSFEKKGDSYYHTRKRKTEEVTASSLKSRWQDIVLAVEESESKLSNSDVNKSGLILPLIVLVLFMSLLNYFEKNTLTNSFFILPTLGIFFSVAALKDLFGVKSEFISKICSISIATSCATIVDSDKWRIFKIVSFGDLSILFFTSQFLSLLLFIINGDISSFFFIQKFLLFCSLPVIFASVYFQKFVEKKWCPICLAISAVVLIELVLLMLFRKDGYSSDVKPYVLFAFVSAAISLAWLKYEEVVYSK